LTAAVLHLVCSSCALRELCLPAGFSDTLMLHLDTLVGAQRSLRRGEPLFRIGDPFKAVHAVRSGFFKTHLVCCRRNSSNCNASSTKP
jgi:CRP/FNR family transcriptional regulator, anaerobic regulatory protein